MKAKVLIVLCLFMFCTGCSRQGDSDLEEGVYIPTISSQYIGYKYSGGYGYAELHLNGQMYTSSEGYTAANREDCVLESVLTDTGTVVYGNHRMYWSDDCSELFEVTEEVVLCTVEGYDPSFLICLYYNMDNPHLETPHQYLIFKCLNGITLHRGSELFSDRYHLDKAVEAIALDYQTGTEYTLSVEDPSVKEFVAALNEGIFLDPEVEGTPTFGVEEGWKITFRDGLGIGVSLVIHGDGYITTRLSGQTAMVLKVDTQACEALLNAIVKTA